MEIKECPQCGAPAKPSLRSCEYCNAEFFITSIAYLSGFDAAGLQKYLKHYKSLLSSELNNVEGNLGLGLCYLQLGMYSMAIKSFEIIILNSPHISQSYYYFCLSKIGGRRIMTMSLKEVKDLEAYLNTAFQLDSNSAICLLLLAIIKYDYYASNGLKVISPTYQDLLKTVNWDNLNNGEIARLKQCVRLPDYSLFNI